MKLNLFMLRLYIQKLGITKAVSILARTKFGGADRIKIPNIKYPFSLRPNTTDNSVFFQVFVLQEYNFSLDFQPEYIIDGGANIGLAAIYFKNRFPKSKIICIEPDNDNIKLLKFNTNKYDDIVIKHSGLWPTKIYAKFVDKYNAGKASLIIEEVDNIQNDDPNVTKTITIDEIMSEFNLDRIDLLKLDIETAEKKLFEENYMNWLPKTKIIVIELHDRMLQGCSQSFFTAINKALTNYSVSASGENFIITNNEI